LIGWQVERVTDKELRENFNGVIDQLLALHHRRSIEIRAA
jgi:hypothetical protein